MPSVYIHMDGSSVKNRLLELHGIESEKEKQKEMFTVKRKNCSRCKFENPDLSSYCGRCGAVLDIRAGVQHARNEQSFINMLINLRRQQVEMAKVIEKLSGKPFEVIISPNTNKAIKNSIYKER